MMNVNVGEWLKMPHVDRYMEIWRTAKNNAERKD